MFNKLLFNSLKVFLFILAISLVLLAPSRSNSSELSSISSNEVDSVFEALSQSNWKSVENITYSLIQREVPSQRYLIARLRYIYLYSIAAQIEKRLIKYDDLRGKLKKIKNKMIIQPWHPINYEGSSCFNQICRTSEKPNHLFTAQTNSNATTIYSFEYYNTGRSIDISSFNDQNARLGGILDLIEINENIKVAEESNSGVTWYFRYNVSDAFIQFER